MTPKIIKRTISEALYLGVLAAVVTAFMLFMPSYPEGDYLGKFLNNWIYFVTFYFAAVVALRIYKGGRLF